jgi:hypothetical protein
VAADTVHADTARRRAYRTDAGRTVLGGGGLVPDVTVAPDTTSLAERALITAVSR